MAQDAWLRDPGLRYWFDRRRVYVMGAGKSGTAAARLLVRLGASVSLTDGRSRAALAPFLKKIPRGVRLELGGHRSLKKNWDLVVVSPGVPEPLWRSFRRRGVPVWGELELGYRVLTLAGRWPLRTAAVTGTNGKTTTTALLDALFRAAGWPAVAAGNIGTPLCDAAAKIGARTALAVEVSSYQLESTLAFRPRVGAVLNVTPDHLKRHGTLAAYARAKFRLFADHTPGDTAVINARDPRCRRESRRLVSRRLFFPGDVRRRGKGLLCSGRAGGGRWPLPAGLKGGHNIENAMAALLAARALGLPAAAVKKAFRTFRGVEHRLEFVRERRGVVFVNDSKATNVDSTVVALKSFPGRMHVILGGEDKGSPYAPLKLLMKARAKAVLLIGEAAPRIEKALAGAVPAFRCGTLEGAVAQAARTAKPGDTVLLSPACASFDQFQNFEHRGRRFKALVGRLRP